MSEHIQALTSTEREALVVNLNEALNQRYTTGICSTVACTGTGIPNEYTFIRLKGVLEDVLAGCKYVVPDEAPYWVYGEDLIHLRTRARWCDSSNEEAYDAFLDCVTADGSALEDDGLPEEIISEIETLSERRKHIIRHLIKLIEETPYEEAA